MRIGMVVPGRGFIGGIERHAHDLADSLRARGHRVTLLFGDGEGPEPDVFVRAFDDALPAREAARVRGRLDLVWVHRANDARELEPYGELPIVVVSHDHELTCVNTHRYLPVRQTPCDLAPGIACVTNGCVVVRDHRPSARLPVTLRSPFALRDALAGLARRASRMVACSRYVASNLIRAGVHPDRVEVLHPIPRDDGSRPLPMPESRRLGVIGSLLRGKGVDIAIRALAQLPGDVTLDIVGDGSSRASLERLAARVAPGRVRFLGWVSPAELGSVYGDLAAVVVPARWPEPFGMTGIEAMRRGRAVIGARHGGIPEWLEQGVAGELFTPGSADDLARAARVVLDDPSAGPRAFTWARDHFPHERLLRQFERIAQSVVQGRGHAERISDHGARL